MAAACAGVAAPTSGPGSFGTPAASAPATLSPTVEPTTTATPTSVATPSPGDTTVPSAAATGCSGSDKNQAFFAKAAMVMAWPVYCAVLPSGWFLVNGVYHVANGGDMQAEYNGPGDVSIALVEGNACAQFGSDTNACVPRDSVIGPANLGDQVGELGQLSQAYVLDVQRGGNPTWRVTGIGLSEADFRAICAAMLRVGAP